MRIKVKLKFNVLLLVLGVKVSARAKVALIVLTLVAVSSAIALVAVPALYYPSYIVKAERLTQKPDTFFVLENPDPMVSQAISNPQKSAEIRSLEDTQIDELIDENNNDNVQVNDSYYQIEIVCVDRFPPPFISLLYLVSPVTLPLSLVAIAMILVKIMRQNSSRNLQENANMNEG